MYQGKQCGGWIRFLGGGCSWWRRRGGCAEAALVQLVQQAGSVPPCSRLWGARIHSPVMGSSLQQKHVCGLRRMVLPRQGPWVHLTAGMRSLQQLLTLFWEGATCSPCVAISRLDWTYCQKTAFNWIAAFLFDDAQKKGKEEEEIDRWGGSCFPSPFQLQAGAGILF